MEQGSLDKGSAECFEFSRLRNMSYKFGGVNTPSYGAPHRCFEPKNAVDDRYRIGVGGISSRDPEDQQKQTGVQGSS
jgi:hypothetical protein